jgi:beta-galactosidase
LTLNILKPWILPSSNDYIANPSDRHQLPDTEPPGNDVAFLQKDFDDGAWETVTLPHDWAIAGPFYTDEDDPVVSGGMGRLPIQGVGWYRRNISWTESEAALGRQAYLDIDGAMSYAIVWLNGKLVGGWPYPYNSFRLDLTPYLEPGDGNVLAIRLDNPNESARWYPGGGIYRNVWLTKTSSVHVGYDGTYITTSDVSSDSAVVELSVRVSNKGPAASGVEIATTVYTVDAQTGKAGEKVAEFSRLPVTLEAAASQSTNSSITIEKPNLWSPEKPSLYTAITSIYSNGTEVDTYETRFGIRTVTYDPNQGLLVNGEHVKIQGVNNHHDLGALGAAFNVRAAERQLEIMQEMGVNAIRFSHNPPAPELLDLTDRMGFLVMDEIFDSWQLNKTDNDFHLIFDDWHEADLRAMARRDRNHPSIFLWSYGNEVGEQYTNQTGAALSARLRDILREEDPTRLSSASQNYATPDLPWSEAVDLFYLNYQGAGIRNTEAYGNMSGIHTQPLYPEYHAKFPEKMILSSETASTLSTRGTYIFPVTDYNSAPINDTSGGDSVGRRVSDYGLYTANFGSSPDKVFAAQDANPFVAGEFVWTGFDYIGEPTPYYSTRSSYSGIVDLAGFKKDRFYQYQSRWRPDQRIAHILPHWSWPDRVGLVTPVHVFSEADSAELFLNGESQGKTTRREGEYRFRWDELVYQPGEVSVVTYRGDEAWANATVRTAGDAAGVQLSADRAEIQADGLDLSFVTAAVVDESGDVVPFADNAISFSVEGPGEIVATDNGDPADFTAFPSLERKAYSGLALAIVRSTGPGTITVKAVGEGLASGEAVLTAE